MKIEKIKKRTASHDEVLSMDFILFITYKQKIFYLRIMCLC